MTGHYDELREIKHGGKVKKSKVARNFGEIVNNQDFNSRCLSYNKGCAIGLIPAMSLQEYEKDNFEEHIDTLGQLDKKAERFSSPMFYSWVNVTCHPEALKFFGVDQF